MRSEFSIVKGIVCDDKAEFKDFFFSCLDVLKREEVALFAVMLWRIWYMRNQFVHGLGGEIDTNVVLWSTNFLNSFLLVITKEGKQCPATT